MRNWTSLVFLLLSATLAAAEPDSEGAEPESKWRLGAALGYGVRTNPLIQSDDIPILVDLDIAWFGERWFFDNGDLGFTLADNESVTASIVARVNSDRVFFSRTNARFIAFDLTGQALAEAVEIRIPGRDYAIELGLEVLSDGDWGMLQAGAYHDVSGTHDGYEIYLDYRYGWRNQRWHFEPSIGAKYKSAALNDYYWGVRDDEASFALPAYEAGSGVNIHGRLAMSYQINKEWLFSLVAQYEDLNGDAKDSPLVDDDGVFAWFGGFAFRF